MKKLLILLIILSTVLAGCNIEKRMARKCAKAERRYELATYKYGCRLPDPIDTVYIHSSTQIIKDTTIYVPIAGDTVKITLRLVEGKKSELKTKYAVSQCWVQNDSLHHILRQIESNIPATIPGAIQITHDSIRIEVPKPFPVDKLVPAQLSWWQKLFIGLGKAAFFTFIAYLLYIIIRFLIRKYKPF